MKYLLFIEQHGPYDHDLLVTDFIQAFDDVKRAVEHYNGLYEGWPYTDDCQIEGCVKERKKIEGGPDVWVDEPYIQVIHTHDGQLQKKIGCPCAIVAEWDGKKLIVKFRTETGIFWIADDET